MSPTSRASSRPEPLDFPTPSLPPFHPQHQLQPTESQFSPSTGTFSIYDRPHNSFVRRIFSRGSQNRLRAANNDDHDGPHRYRTCPPVPIQPSPTKLDFIMTPSPNTHPLLCKPSARDEIGPKLRKKGTGTGGIYTPSTLGSSRPNSNGTVCSFANARKEAQRVLESRGCGIGYYPRSRPVTMGSGSGSSGEPNDLYTRSLRDRERIATEAALEAGHVREWGFFIKCYAEGRFNLSNPPDPPPMRPGFRGLPAPKPVGEEERLKAVKTHSISLPLPAREKCQRLVLLATTVFQTSIAAISIIDEYDEIVKADHGFPFRFIDRADSIAAHVLLSNNEPMVIVDTEQDWRLRGNPLVRGESEIRFFAGAPIITYEGHTIGVFSVMDTQPRTSFPAASRRKLLDFARLVMTEVEMAVEQQELPSMPAEGVVDMMLPRVLRDQDAESVISRRGALSSRLLAGIEADAQRIASSYPANEATEVFPTSLTNPQPQLSAPPPKRPMNHIPIQIPPYADNGAGVYKHCSSGDSVSSFDSDEEAAEVMETPPLTPCRPFSISSLASSAISTLTDPLNTFSALTPRNSLASDVVTVPESPPAKPSTLSEAAFATSLIARSLNYDLVYLLRVYVAPPETQDQYIPYSPLPPAPSITTKVMVSHGLPDPPPVFDAALHLRALRSLGGLVYKNPIQEGDEEADTVGYRTGILLPLSREAGGGGVVLAAFSGTERGEGEGDGEGANGEEVKFLKEFGETMGDVLMGADGV